MGLEGLEVISHKVMESRYLIPSGMGKPTEWVLLFLNMNLNESINGPHFCRYIVFKKTVAASLQKTHWIEKCRCGLMVDVSVTRRETPEKLEVKVSKRWFDRDGKLTRTTGTDAYLPCNITKTIDNQ